MQTREPLGPLEYSVLRAVRGGALRSRCTAQQVPALRERPAGEVILHDVLRRCDRDGLLWSERGPTGRRYELTAAGRARLRADLRFRAALTRVLARTGRQPV